MGYNLTAKANAVDRTKECLLCHKKTSSLYLFDFRVPVAVVWLGKYAICFYFILFLAQSKFQVVKMLFDATFTLTLQLH